MDVNMSWSFKLWIITNTLTFKSGNESNDEKK